MRDSRELAGESLCDLLRTRLTGIAHRLELAALESERADMLRISALIVASAKQIRALLDASALPPIFRVESVIGRAEQTLAVWISLKTF